MDRGAMPLSRGWASGKELILSVLIVSNDIRAYLLVVVIIFISIPMFFIVLLTQIAVGGINFAPKAIQFKGKKINPVEGFKRMFSQKSLAELVKAILKVLCRLKHY